MGIEEMTGSELEAISTVVRGLLPRAKALLEKHGCRVSTWGDGSQSLILFPPGTIRTELLPQTQETRYRLMFPSGLELREESLPGKGYKALFADSPTGKAFLRGNNE